MKNNMPYFFFQIVNIFNKTECVKRFALGLSVTKYRQIPLIIPGLTRFIRGFRWAYKWGAYFWKGACNHNKKCL